MKLDEQQRRLKKSYCERGLSPCVSHALAFMCGMECDQGNATISDPVVYVRSSLSGQMVLRALLGESDTEALIFEFFSSFINN